MEVYQQGLCQDFLEVGFGVGVAGKGDAISKSWGVIIKIK
jgi:hypothetical protein